MNKAWLAVLAFLIVASIALAQTYETGEIDMKVPCIYNGTYCGASTTCNLTLMDFNENATIDNQAMTRQAAYYNYTTTLSEVGEYQLFMACYDGTNNGFFPAIITITRNGKEPADGVFKLFIWVLFMVSTAGLFIAVILTFAKLVTASETIFGVIFSWLFLLLLLLTIILSKYLLDSWVYDTSNMFYDIAIWSNGLFPLIGLIVTMFIKGMEKKRPMSMQELNGGMRYGN